MMMPALVAIIGRPNVGKSTLFNRLVRSPDALVDPMAGLTRDLRTREREIGGAGEKVSFIDTAGLEDSKAKESHKLGAQMTKQALKAVEAADLVLFVLDGRSDLLPADEMWARLLRKKAKKILLIVNKCESPKRSNSLEALRLGLGEPLTISAEHNLGIYQLEEEILVALGKSGKIVAETEETEETEEPETLAPETQGAEDRALKLSIIGRPNAGKSSLVNLLLGEEHQLTDAEAGTTRDSISFDWQWEEQKIKLYDTAGLRRRARIIGRAERLSVSSALQAIRFSDIVVLLFDGQKPFETQDLRLAELVIREGRGLVIAVNKMDLVSGVSQADIARAAEHYLPQLRGVPVVCFSVKNNKGVEQLMPHVMIVKEAWNRRISTSPLNSWLQSCVGRRPPPSVRGRATRIKYITQKSARPPTFIVFTSRTKKLPEDYMRYLMNDMRKTFGFEGTPLRFDVRPPTNPYV